MAYLNGNMNIMRFVTRENEAPRYKGIFPLPIDSVGGEVSEWYLYGNKNGVGEKRIVNGNLPLNFVSDGTDLENYRIYGTVEGAGAQTENLFDFDEYDIGGTTFITKTLTLEPNTAYTMSSNVPLYKGGALIVFVAMGESAPTPKNGVYKDHPITKTTDASGKIRVGLRDNGSGYDLSIYKTMLVKGSTAPSSYIPHGYKIPLTVKNSTETKTIDVYIGDSKLGEEEYVDYGEQKIYKRILFMTHDDKHFITKDNKDFCLRRRGYSD